MEIRNKAYLHPIPVRIWHWINAFGIVFLLLTGLLIRYGETIAPVIPAELAIRLHNLIGLVVIAAYLFWFGYGILTQQIGLYIPAISSLLSGVFKQIKYYVWDYFRGLPNPHQTVPNNKFNALQKLIYFAIMFLLLPVQIVSGCLFWRVKLFEDIISFMGGIKIVSSIHLLSFFLLAAFVLMHLYLATTGDTPFSYIKAMITGYEDKKEG